MKTISQANTFPNATIIFFTLIIASSTFFSNQPVKFNHSVSWSMPGVEHTGNTGFKMRQIHYLIDDVEICADYGESGFSNFWNRDISEMVIQQEKN